MIWAGMALFLLVGRIALLPVLPIPDPVIQDEFSYLLAADTFAHGRVSNPGLAHADFFESPHVLVEPSYVSKYPPGQAFFLAAGQKLAGHPFWGVVLSCALMVFLFCWAADAWLPPQWAFIAGGLTILFFFVRLYWLESYWGGAVAACGGALVAGGLGHLLRGRAGIANVAMAAGAVVLFFTRPYEGGVLCLVALAILTYKNLWTRRLLLPALLILAAGGFTAAWYNLRTTGHVAQLPFLLYAKQYDLAPKFLMQAETPGKIYQNLTMATTHTYELKRYRVIRAESLPVAIWGQLEYFVGHCLLQPYMGFALLFAGIPWALLRGRKKWLFVLFAASFGAMLPEAWIQFHYTAPFTVVSVILMVGIARALWYRLAFASIPAALRGLAVSVSLVVFIGPFLFHYMGLRPRRNPRASMVRRLEAMPGKQLVFVSYRDGWDYASEWVYNGSSPDAGRVLFAHDLGEKDGELVRQYPERTPWKLVLGPGGSEARLERMSPSILTSNR
jgi:hypothetical protein